MLEETPNVANERAHAGTHIEWTGAGGDYYLAVVIDARPEVIAEHWGTRKEVTAWMETQYPGLPRCYVPMALGATRRPRKKAPDGSGRGLKKPFPRI